MFSVVDCSTRIKIPKIDNFANNLKSKEFRPIVPLEVVHKLGYSDSFDTIIIAAQYDNPTRR